MDVSAKTAAALAVLAMLGPGAARAEEVCRYTGAGDYDAHIAVETRARRTGEAERIRVLWRLDARALLVFRIKCWVEEVSDWRGGVLQTVALNVRYFVNGRIVKQQWDVFDRDADGFAAWRIQAKTPEILAAGHDGFGAMWDPATFGAPWLDAYRASHPERRTDLDLRPGEAPPDLAPPFAEGFYRVRGAAPRPQRAALFLPGNKKQRRADIAVPAPEPAPDGGHVWRVPLDSEKLGIRPGSAAEATVSAADMLEDVRFKLASGIYAAKGGIRLDGCAGAPEDAGTR